TITFEDMLQPRGPRTPPKELVVLKLDFGQIALRTGARRSGKDTPGEADDEQRQTTDIDPRQVLIEIIKGLHQQLVQDRHLTRWEQQAVRDWSELVALDELVASRQLMVKARFAAREHIARAFFRRRHQGRYWRSCRRSSVLAVLRSVSRGRPSG